MSVMVQQYAETLAGQHNAQSPARFDSWWANESRPSGVPGQLTEGQRFKIYVTATKSGTAARMRCVLAETYVIWGALCDEHHSKHEFLNSVFCWDDY
jgi:hypothetical protein